MADLLPLLNNTPERARQVAAFDRLDDAMAIGTMSPSAKAADIIAGILGR
jgi:lipid-A-disaccharide synthase